MSLYIQITNRCNMTCAHCCFACTAKGTDMTRETFQAAIQLAKEQEQHITIGGGEPTLHPLFREFVMHAVWELAELGEHSGMPAVHMVTNGSNTEIALNIASLARQGVITAAVSHDDYHDPIDERVYRAFEKPKKDYYAQLNSNDHDYRSVNGGGGFIIPVGRAKSWGDHPFIKCVCDSPFVTPKGTVYPCGCKKTALGTLPGSVDIHSEHFEGYCQRDTAKYKENVLDQIAQYA